MAPSPSAEQAATSGGTQDEFHYAFITLDGDGSITARVATLTGSEVWTKPA